MGNYLERLECLLEKLNSNTIMFADMNIDLLTWNHVVENYLNIIEPNNTMIVNNIDINFPARTASNTIISLVISTPRQKNIYNANQLFNTLHFNILDKEIRKEITEEINLLYLNQLNKIKKKIATTPKTNHNIKIKFLSTLPVALKKGGDTRNASEK